MVGTILKRRTFRRLLCILFLFGGSGTLLADMSDQVTCADVHDVGADPTPQNVLGLYIMRRPEDQRDRIFRGDLQGQHPLFQEVWDLRGQRVALDEQFRALVAWLEEYQQETAARTAARQDRLDRIRRETRLKQQELVGQEKQMAERNLSELQARLSQAKALEAEMDQVDAQLAEKSRALLEDERNQVCVR